MTETGEGGTPTGRPGHRRPPTQLTSAAGLASLTVGMPDGSDAMHLQPWQAERIGRTAGPMLGYLHRLRSRAEQVLDPNDRLFLLIDQAYNAVHGLSVELHYRGCKGGAGRPPDSPGR
jgi:hypothetical protein